MTGSRRLVIWISLSLLLAVGVIYALVDPAKAAWMPKCPMHLFTGLDCPGCGSQRAIHALLNGDLAGAWNANAILFLAIPYILVVAFAEIFSKRFPRLLRVVSAPAVIYSFTWVLIIWAVARNLWLR